MPPILVSNHPHATKKQRQPSYCHQELGTSTHPNATLKREKQLGQKMVYCTLEKATRKELPMQLYFVMAPDVECHQCTPLVVVLAMGGRDWL